MSSGSTSPIAPSSRVASLTPDLADRATQTFVDGFLDDPLIEWIFDDPASRKRLSRHVFRVFVQYFIRYAHGTQLEDGHAVSLWLEPGETIKMGRMMRCGFFGLPFRTGFGRFSRFGGAQDQMDKIHKRVVTEPHWYLMGLSVDPERQGGGRGGELVRAGTAKADEAACPCYLETSRPRNLAFYRRHGFEVVEETTLGKDGPPAWAMVRPARLR